MKIIEGFNEKSTPDMKYYAFDWDDNIVYMPTEIILIDNNDDEVGMSTHDFAKYRGDIGKTEFMLIYHLGNLKLQVMNNF
jgi:hypothetical protein